MTPGGVLGRLDRLPSTYGPGVTTRVLWGALIAAITAGVGLWATGSLGGGVGALWCFTAAAVGLALVLPLPLAIVSPLYMGVAGWLVDMLPFVVLAGWTTLVIRWSVDLVADNRMPRGGKWLWLPVALVAWTALGAFVITSADFKHFLLLLGIQVVISGVILAAVDGIRARDDRTTLVAALVGFVVLLSAAVFLQWIGVPVESLQDGQTRRRVEAAYGVDAFPNNIGMIKYARSVEAGSLELRRELEDLSEREPELPDFEVFRPKFQAFENSLVVRFAGSARAAEDDLAPLGVRLLYDNVGLAPANTVPRMRSFPRNALTYAGTCAALLPFAFFLAWTGERRRKLLGQVGVVACLFGAAFSLARGAWVAIAIGIAYLFLVGVVRTRWKLQVVGAFLAMALILTTVFLVRYGVDPVTGRAGGGASVNTRGELYQETLDYLTGVHLLVGFGTERPRTETGTVKEGTRYVPRAGTHSTYLNYLFRTGVPGALGVMALYVLAFLSARAGSRAGRDDDDRLFAATASMSVVIAAAHAVILSLYVEPVYSLTISVILGLALGTAAGTGVRLVPERLRRRS